MAKGLTEGLIDRLSAIPELQISNKPATNQTQTSLVPVEYCARRCLVSLVTSPLHSNCH